MPVSTPNRVNQPVMLERFDPPAVVRQAGEIVVQYYNRTGSTILQGEPVFVGGRVGLAENVILPNQIGQVIMDWVADLRVNPALGAAVLVGATVWWSYDITTVAAGVGGAVSTAPTNGFIIGVAIAPPYGPSEIRIGGTNQLIAAAPGDAFIRVMSNYEPVTAIGTVPAFN